jgi:hypothetical protein
VTLHGSSVRGIKLLVAAGTATIPGWTIMLEMLTFVMRRDRIAQTSTWILSGIVILLCSTNRYEIEASGGAVDPANVPPGAEVVLLSFEVEKYDTRARDA